MSQPTPEEGISRQAIERNIAVGSLERGLSLNADQAEAIAELLDRNEIATDSFIATGKKNVAKHLYGEKDKLPDDLAEKLGLMQVMLSVPAEDTDERIWYARMKIAAREELANPESPLTEDLLMDLATCLIQGEDASTISLTSQRLARLVGDRAAIPHLTIAELTHPGRTNSEVLKAKIDKLSNSGRTKRLFYDGLFIDNRNVSAIANRIDLITSHLKPAEVENAGASGVIISPSLQMDARRLQLLGTLSEPTSVIQARALARLRADHQSDPDEEITGPQNPYDAASPTGEEETTTINAADLEDEAEIRYARHRRANRGDDDPATLSIDAADLADHLAASSEDDPDDDDPADKLGMWNVSDFMQIEGIPSDDPDSENTGGFMMNPELRAALDLEADDTDDDEEETLQRVVLDSDLMQHAKPAQKRMAGKKPSRARKLFNKWVLGKDEE